MQSNNPYVNIAAYKFISFDDTAEKRPQFRALCEELDLKGTILLSPEGINLFLAGLREPIDRFLAWLRADPRFADLEVKESYSEKQPFTKMLVKLKREIITMKMPVIQPEKGRAPAVNAPTLKRWLDQGHDDAGKPVVMMDTRNAFEVTFCTGGIRCEKAAIHMQNVGFDSVYQLEGGILKYFEEVGGAHYTGDCFVFDYRTAVNPNLEETATVQCFACRAVVTPREQLSPFYIAGKSCPHCKKEIRETDEQAQAE
jgi:UPF0176 protein